MVLQFKYVETPGIIILSQATNVGNKKGLIHAHRIMIIRGPTPSLISHSKFQLGLITIKTYGKFMESRKIIRF